MKELYQPRIKTTIKTKENSSRNFRLQSMKPLPAPEIKANEETQIDIAGP